MPQENEKEEVKKGEASLGLPEKLRKADLFLTDLSSGGLLATAQ